MLFPTCIFKACNYGNLLRDIDNYLVVGYKGLKFPWTKSLSKNQLISKGNFSVFKATKKTNKIFVRISALASKKAVESKR